MLRLYWQSPDLVLAFAGPFTRTGLLKLACGRGEWGVPARPAKRLIKALLLTAKTSGLKPACLHEKENDHDGLTEQSVSEHHTETKRIDIAHDGRPWEHRFAARPPNDRRRRRSTGEREAIGDRPSTRLGTAENSATLQGQSVAGYRRDRRAVDGWHSFLVTDARATPPVAAQTSVWPRRPARTTQARRPGRARSATTPRRAAADE